MAPYYGVDQDWSRGGWRRDFVQRIRRAEYAQCIWDSLPIGGPRESILRLDHVYPIARNPAAFEVSEHRLTTDALGIVDEWFHWLTTNMLADGGLLSDIRAELLAMP